MKKILLSFVLALSVLLCGCNTDEEMKAHLGFGKAIGVVQGYIYGYDDGYSDAEAEFSVYPTGDYYVDTATDPLTIREEARQNADKVGTIPRGEDITVTETKSHWGFVTYDGLSGWINLDYCAQGNNPNPPAEYATEIVYVTNTGDCYHKDGCGSLWNSKIPMSLEDAEKNYRPCSKCF